MTEAKKIRVLLADDEAHIRVLIRAIVQPLNCEVVAEATNGEEAVALFKAKRPDMALLDINMPVKDGEAALREIMAFDPGAMVIMLTSVVDVGTVQSSIDVGASHYIRKDTPPLQMREIITETWKQYLAARGGRVP